VAGRLPHPEHVRGSPIPAGRGSGLPLRWIQAKRHVGSHLSKAARSRTPGGVPRSFTLRVCTYPQSVSASIHFFRWASCSRRQVVVTGMPFCVASRAAIISDKKAREPTSRDDCDSLSLAQVLSRWISGTGQLVAKHLDVLVLSRVGIKRLAEDILCRAQCG
jgi:hypothetical protein